MESVLSDFITFISGVPQNVIVLILGVILLLFGYRLKRITMAAIGFVVGWSIAANFAPQMVGDPFWQFIIKLAAGALLGVMATTIERLAIFAVVALAFGSSFYDAFAIQDPMAHISIAVAVGVIAGVISVWFIKPMFIIASGLKGAQLLSTLAAGVFNLAAPWPLIILVALAAVGIGFQWKDCKSLD